MDSDIFKSLLIEISYKTFQSHKTTSIQLPIYIQYIAILDHKSLRRCKISDTAQATVTQMFCKIGVFKMFRGKHLRWNLFYKKIQVFKDLQ